MKLWIILVLIVCMIGIANAVLVPTDLTNYYAFDEVNGSSTAYDSYDSLNMSMNVPHFDFIAGKHNNAISVIDSSYGNFNALISAKSVAFWVYIKSYTPYNRGIVTNGVSIITSSNTSSTSDFWQIGIGDGSYGYTNGQILIESYNGWMSSATILNTGQWYHMVVLANDSGDTPTVYVNGVLESMTVDSGTITGLFSFGEETLLASFERAGYLPPKDQADVIIDELGFYNIALSQADVDYLYDAGDGRFFNGTAFEGVPEPMMNYSSFYRCEDTQDGNTFSLINDSINVYDMTPSPVLVGTGINGSIGCRLPEGTGNAFTGSVNSFDKTICAWTNITSSTSLFGTYSFSEGDGVNYSSNTVSYYDLENNILTFTQSRYQPLNDDIDFVFFPAHKLYGWHYICSIIDYSDYTVSAYIDGILLASHTDAGMIFPQQNDSGYVIGYYARADDGFTAIYGNVTLDDILFYDGELNSTDIQALFEGYNQTICYENWVATLGQCIDDNQTVTYSDTHNCGTTYEKPLDTTQSCGVNTAVARVSNILLNIMVVAIIGLIILGVIGYMTDSDMVKVIFMAFLVAIGIIAFIVAISFLSSA